jgi:hypothetical protein
LQHLVADRFDIADDGVRHRCTFCDVPFAVRWEDAVALGVLDVVMGLPRPANAKAATTAASCG